MRNIGRFDWSSRYRYLGDQRCKAGAVFVIPRKAREEQFPLQLLGLALLLLTITSRPGYCEDLVVRVPEKSRVSVATAIERDSAVNVGGSINGNQARFSNLSPDTPYDIAIELTDGTLLCGADLSWCDPTPADPQAEALGDDDRQAIQAIVCDILGFADKPKLIMLQGTHDRATGLVDLVRSKGFHSDKGDEVIWRVEIWFFKWENGGWERVADQSRLMRRERFQSKSAYEKEVGRVRWVPELGGVQLKKSAAPVTLTISPPATTASGSPADSLPPTPLPPP